MFMYLFEFHVKFILCPVNAVIPKKQYIVSLLSEESKLLLTVQTHLTLKKNQNFCKI